MCVDRPATLDSRISGTTPELGGPELNQHEAGPESQRSQLPANYHFANQSTYEAFRVIRPSKPPRFSQEDGANYRESLVMFRINLRELLSNEDDSSRCTAPSRGRSESLVLGPSYASQRLVFRTLLGYLPNTRCGECSSYLMHGRSRPSIMRRAKVLLREGT